MTPKAFHALFGRIGVWAKMPFPVHPHMLRHGCGYALANAGHDTRALQAWLGHKNPYWLTPCASQPIQRPCPCRAASSRPACPPKRRNRRAAIPGCTRSSTTASASLRARMPSACGSTAAPATPELRSSIHPNTRRWPWDGLGWEAALTGQPNNRAVHIERANKEGDQGEHEPHNRSEVERVAPVEPAPSVRAFLDVWDDRR
jgi:Phage integrase family